MRTHRLIKLPDVKAKIGRGNSWIYDQIRKGNFPRQVQVGLGAVCWVEAEIDAWIEARIAERDQKIAA